MSYGIIIVDDEYWIRSLIRSYTPEDDGRFKLLGEAEDGLEGLELCRTLHPDILITDIKMPGLSGLDMLEILKVEQPEIQVIIISGYEEFKYAKRAIQYGAIDYLLKPIERDSVYKLLDQAESNLDRIRIDKVKITKMKEKIDRIELIFLFTNVQFSIKDSRIKKAVQFIHNNYNKDISLTDAASVAAMNRNYFSESFKKSIGQGFGEYLTLIRLRQAVVLLQIPDLKIVEIANRCGYRDPNYFSRVFKKNIGLIPGNCRNMDKRLSFMDSEGFL